MGQKSSREAATVAARLGELEARTAQLKLSVNTSNTDLWQAIDALEEQVVPRDYQHILLWRSHILVFVASIQS